MNTDSEDLPDLWFKVIRYGRRKIKVKRGCVFRFTGEAYPLTSLKTGDIDISGGMTEDPAHDTGTHFFVEEEEFSVNGDGQVWLLLNLTANLRIWQLSIAEDDGVNHNGYPDGSALLQAVTYTLFDEGSLSYEFKTSPPPIDQSGFNAILIANITIEEGVLKIEQIHDGVLVLNRIIRYTN